MPALHGVSSVGPLAFLDDIAAAGDRFRKWADDTAKAVRDWAASEHGQNTLLTVDFLSLSARIGDFYAHIGWYLPVHPALHRYVLELREHHAPFDARDAVRLVGPGSTHWPWIVEGTLASPSVSSRRQIVEDALFCMEHERWHGAVSTLLPVLEGIVADHSAELEGKRVGRRVESILDTEAGEWEALSAVVPLTLLDSEIFDRLEFSDVSIADEALNRHVILHGRTANFGTPINAVRVFMFLVALVELLDGAVIFRASSPPVDEGSFLDEYGPLAGLRAAARRRPGA